MEYKDVLKKSINMQLYANWWQPNKICIMSIKVKILFVFLILLLGCKKEPSPILEDYFVIDTLPNKNDELLLLNKEFFIEPYHQDSLDTNNDNLPDLVFKYNWSASIGGKRVMDIRIQTLNNLEVALLTKIDTFCEYKVGYFTFIENYSTTKDYGLNYKLYIETSNCINAFNYNDTLNLSINWQKGNFCFKYNDTSSGGGRTYNSHHGFWNNNTNRKYLGIKYEKDNIINYGWLMISTNSDEIIIYKIGNKKIQ